jgi:transcriptional regulator GlxA family with amidase domain
LKDIGRRCGFSSAAHFRTVFKRHTGLSPGQHRRVFRI